MTNTSRGTKRIGFLLGTVCPIEPLRRETKHTVEDDRPFLFAVGIRGIDIIDFDSPCRHTTQDMPDGCGPESLRIVGKTHVEVISGGMTGFRLRMKRPFFLQSLGEEQNVAL